MMGLSMRGFFDDPRGTRTIDDDGDILLINDFIPRHMTRPYFDSLFYDIDWKAHDLFRDGAWRPNTRLIHWFGNRRYSYAGLDLDPTRMTDVATVADIARKVEDYCKTTFNTCLANLYRSGDDSIGMHSDNEPELGDRPLIASVSLGGTRNFRLHARRGPRKIVVPLEAGSLLIMRGLSQQNWYHGINKEPGALARINLTFRIMI